MMTPIYMFSIPFFYFTLAAAKAADILPVFHILLDKLGPCDIQIIADGWRTNIDWHNNKDSKYVPGTVYIEAPLRSWCSSNQELIPLGEVVGHKLRNPFNKIIKKFTATGNVVQIVFLTVNQTRIPRCTFTSEGRFEFRTTNHNLNWRSYLDTSVSIGPAGYEYLSCYRQEYVSFRFYITPFEPRLWVALGISLVSIVAILSTYKYFTALRGISFSAWLFILGTLFEESSPIPVEIGRRWFVRFILGSWCVVSLILTNCYSGTMISELNSPLPALRPSSFADLVCENIEGNDVPKFHETYNIMKAKMEAMFYNNSHLKDGSTDIMKSFLQGTPKNIYGRVAWYFAHTREIILNSERTSLWKFNAWTAQKMVNPFSSSHCFRLLSLPHISDGYLTHPELLQVLNLFVKDDIKEHKIQIMLIGRL
ncbi:hypothetical protein Fcan01_23981 [Folsomia candida]|uniref:Uncharacterized protein n=1 Tax=Folsomia candida TaxID=158441 RepID=A0A226D6R8_FOLCA|nr:hypothetical protein Fcan01_23981 [Folsomia candida]